MSMASQELIAAHFPNRSILDLTLDLHLYCTDSISMTSANDAATIANILNLARETWEPSANKLIQEFEDAVRELICIVLIEYQTYSEEQ